MVSRKTRASRLFEEDTLSQKPTRGLVPQRASCAPFAERRRAFSCSRLRSISRVSRVVSFVSDLGKPPYLEREQRVVAVSRLFLRTLSRDRPFSLFETGVENHSENPHVVAWRIPTGAGGGVHQAAGAAFETRVSDFETLPDHSPTLWKNVEQRESTHTRGLSNPSKSGSRREGDRYLAANKLRKIDGIAELLAPSGARRQAFDYSDFGFGGGAWLRRSRGHTTIESVLKSRPRPRERRVV